MVLPTNTRALVTVNFNDDHIVNALEVAQFYYVYQLLSLLFKPTHRPYIGISVISNFRVADFDKPGCQVRTFRELRERCSDHR